MAESKKLPTFMQMKQTGQMVLESQTTPEMGYNIQIIKPITQAFNMTYGLDFCPPNPMFGMQPQAKPTDKSKFSIQGMGVFDIHQGPGGPQDQQPGAITQFQLVPDLNSVDDFKNSELNCSVRKLLSNDNMINWSFGQSSQEKGKFSLCRELTFQKTTEAFAANVTLAQPTLLEKSGLTFQGVLESGLVAKVNDSWKVGAQILYRRMANPMAAMMGGPAIQASTTPTLMVQYCHEDKVDIPKSQNPKNAASRKFADGSGHMTAKATTTAFIDPMSQNVTFEHLATGGPTYGRNELFASLTCGKDPMPVQYGGTGGFKVEGTLGMSCTLQDMSIVNKKQQAGMPQADNTTVVKSKITTEGDVVTTVEGKVYPLGGITYGTKMSYNVWKDSMKLGASFGAQLG